jgi:hypothetical protein
LSGVIEEWNWATKANMSKSEKGIIRREDIGVYELWAENVF